MKSGSPRVDERSPRVETGESPIFVILSQIYN